MMIMGRLYSFNSMKVRLKPLGLMYSLNCIMRFNSMKVRLKHRVLTCTRLRTNVFQFHEGPIKTLRAYLHEIARECVSIP